MSIHSQKQALAHSHLNANLSPEAWQARITRTFIQDSAISPELFTAAVKFHTDFEQDFGGEALYPIHEALGWSRTRFPHRVHRPFAAAFLRNEDGSVWQLALQDGNDPRGYRYQAPKGVGNKAYFPPITLGIWRIIAEHNKIGVEAPWLRVLEKYKNQQMAGGDLSAFSRQHGKTALEIIRFALTSQDLSSTESPPCQSLSGIGFGTKQAKNTRTTPSPSSRKTEAVSASEVLQYVKNLPDSTLVPDFWGFVAEYPEIALSLVEGGKKCLCLLSNGTVTIAVYGCQCLKSPDLIPFLKGRNIVIAFDSDTKPTAILAVQRGLRAGVPHLEAHGAIVRVATWDSSLGKGVDDLIANNGIEAWEKALNEAQPYRVDTYAIALNRARIAFKNSLREGDIVLSEPMLPRNYWRGVEGDIAVCSGLGTCKSEGIGDLIAHLPRDASVVALTHRVALGSNLAERWGLDLINHLDSGGGYLFNTYTNRISTGRRVAACLDSVHLTPNAPDLLILDEVAKDLRHLLTGGTCKKKRPLLLQEFIQRLQKAKRVIITDADLTDLEIGFIEAIRGQRCTLIRNDYRHSYNIKFLQSPNETAAIAKAVELLQDGQRVMVLCSQKSTAIAIDTLLSEYLEPSERFLIHGDNSGDDERHLFLTNPNAYLQRAGLRALVASPTIAEGVSITGDYFDAIVGVFHASSIDDASICQFIRRDRRDIPRYVWVQSGRGQKPLPWEELRYTEQSIARFTLKSTGFGADAVTLSWGSAAQTLAYKYRTQQGWAIANLRAATQARLEHQGYTIEFVEAGSNSEIRDKLTAIAKRTKQAYCEGVANAATLDDPTAAAIERKIQQGKSTPEERLALARHLLEGFYAVSATPELVSVDRKGRWAQALAKLEDVGCHDRAQDLDRATIETLAEQGGEIMTGDMPQRYALATAVQALGLEDFMIELIRDGREYSLDDPAVQEIARRARVYAAEVRLLFGFTPGPKQPDTTIVGSLLAALGLRTKCRRHRTPDGVKRIYQLDWDHLLLVSSILRRRHERRVKQGENYRSSTLFDLILRISGSPPPVTSDSPHSTADSGLPPPDPGQSREESRQD